MKPNLKEVKLIMLPTELKVISEAIRWWENHKPLIYTTNEHFANPEINCFTNSDRKLARAIARFIKQSKK